MASDLMDANQTLEPSKRLVMVSTYFEEHCGGLEIVAGALARELASQDFAVAWLATGSTSDNAKSSKIRKRRLPATNIAERLVKLPYPVLFPSAWCVIFDETRRADVVLVHDGLYMTSVAAYFATRVYRKPFVVVQHIGLVPYRSPFLRKLMEAANRLVAVPILRRADKVIFISQLTLRYFANIGWLRMPALVFNGVDAKIFSPPGSEAEIENARRSLDLPLGNPIALFVGRFVEKKGLHILARIAREHPDIFFAFAGWGALDPSSWKLPNVRVFTPLSGASLARLYRASDLLLLPSVGEGFPLVVQEALACGLPIVCGLDTASADSSAAPFLKGVTVDLHDPERTAQLFSQEMARLLAKPNTTAERMKRSEFAHSRYSWATAAEHYTNMLHQLS